MAVTGQVLANMRYLQISDGAGDTIKGDLALTGSVILEDEMSGRGGNDVLIPGGGLNIVDGGPGDDTIVFGTNFAGGGRVVAVGGKGHDSFVIASEAIAKGLKHNMNGAAGVDTLSVFYQPHAVQSGPMLVRGANVSFGTNPVLARINDIERIEGSPLDDLMRPGPDVTTLIGLGGDDRLFAARNVLGVDMAGNTGNDILMGSDGPDVIFDGDLGLFGQKYIPKAFGDSDVLKGKGGGDIFYAVSGADRIVGGSGDDIVYAIVSGLPGTIRISGGIGDDIVAFQLGSFYFDANDAAKRALTINQSELTACSLDGGSGTDKVDFYTVGVTSGVDKNLALGITLNLSNGKGTERGTGTEGAFVANNFENVMGTQRSDTILGDRQKNELEGNSGEDVLRGRGGNDTLFGDTSHGMISADDNSVDRIYGGAGRDRLFGGGGKDQLFGGEGKDRLFGGSGKDNIVGGRGDDEIFGGDASDKLSGGNGSDVFVFFLEDETTTDSPIITDFDALQGDVVVLRSSSILVNDKAPVTEMQLTNGVLVEWYDWDLLLKGASLSDLTERNLQIVIDGF